MVGTWQTGVPIGTLSVKQNRPGFNNNFLYIENTMGNGANPQQDHFWNVSPTLDGYHRTVNMQKVPANIQPAIGVDGVIYMKAGGTTVADVEVFFKNKTQDNYAISPCFLQGTFNSHGSYGTVVTVPQNVYGEIFMWQTISGTLKGSSGFFKSNTTTCDAWAYSNTTDSSSSSVPLKYGSGSSASGLTIQARNSDESSVTWNYRITYRAIAN